MSSTIPSTTERTSNTQELKEKKKNPRQPLQNTIRRSIIYAIIGAACGSVGAIAANGGLLTIATSFVISALLGAAIAILQGYEQRVSELEHTHSTIISDVQRVMSANTTEVKNLLAEKNKNEQEMLRVITENEQKMIRITEEFNNLVQNAATSLNFYSTLRTLLDGRFSQKWLIQGFSEFAMSHPVFTQPMQEETFFHLAEKGIEQCKETWQAIHQGHISKFPHSPYLLQLKETGVPLKKQRIVIFDEGEYDELGDYHKVDEFLRVTEGTDAYWIPKDKFYEEFDVPTKMRLDDAALYDGKLLILRNRDTQLAMLAVKGQGDRACEAIINAFNALNWDISHNQIGRRFKRIERPKVF